MTDTTTIPIIINHSGVTIQDLSFVHDQGSVTGSWSPRPYPETILVDTVSNVQLTNLHFENPTFAIRAFQVSGNLKIGRISGQPLMTGIQIENCHGNVSVDGVEFSPQWNSSSIVLNYQTSNNGLVAIKSVGNTVNDTRNVVFSHILATYCRVGFLFTGAGLPLGNNTNQRVEASGNAASVTGIRIEGPTKRIIVTGYAFVGIEVSTLVGTQGSASECAIHASDDFGYLNVVNMTSIGSHENAILLGRSSLALLSNLFLQDWAQSGKSIPAIESTGAWVEVYKPYTFSQKPGSTAPLIGGNVHLM